MEAHPSIGEVVWLVLLLLWVSHLLYLNVIDKIHSEP